MNKNSIKLAGHEFTLKNVQYGIHSDETVDFIATLICDKKPIAEVENDGHGGATFSYIIAENREWARCIEAAVSEEVWLTCKDGTIIHYDLGTVADEALAKIELNKDVAKLQKEALVLRHPENYEHYDPYLYTRKIGTISLLVQDAPGSLAKKIAEAQDDGWEVLNTNIPKRIYEAAKDWRLPVDVKGRNAWRFPCISGKK